MNTGRLALVWLTATEVTSVPVGSKLVQPSADLVLVLVPSGDLYIFFVGSPTVMRVPDQARDQLMREHFDGDRTVTTVSDT